MDGAVPPCSTVGADTQVFAFARGQSFKQSADCPGPTGKALRRCLASLGRFDERPRRWGVLVL